jgi:hypothetical protein
MTKLTLIKGKKLTFSDFKDLTFSESGLNCDAGRSVALAGGEVVDGRHHDHVGRDLVEGKKSYFNLYF